MGKATKWTDLFLNYVSIKLTTGASATTLVEQSLPTGLSVRGQYGWAIHAVEFMLSQRWVATAAAPTGVVQLGLTTKRGLAAIPSLGDDGTLAVHEEVRTFITSGETAIVRPHVVYMSPPVIIASPNLSLYWKASFDHAPLRAAEVIARIAYTTFALDSAAYTEIAETWGG